jgi:hypothetical protein
VRAAFSAGTIASTGQTICNGGTVTTVSSSTAASGGDGSISYQWYEGSSTISGATAATYSPDAYKSTAGTYNFTRRAQDGSCNSSTRSAGTWVLVAVDLPARPNTPTHNGPTCIGTAITFTVTGGSGPYEWEGDTGAPSSGAITTSTTHTGMKTVRVRMSRDVAGVTCWSFWSSYASATVTRPSDTCEPVSDLCGCAPPLINCHGTCLANCPTRSSACFPDQNGIPLGNWHHEPPESALIPLCKCANGLELDNTYYDYKLNVTYGTDWSGMSFRCCK